MVSSRRRSDRFGSIKRQYSQAQMLNTVIQIAGNQYSRRLQDSNVKIVFRLYLTTATVCLHVRLIYQQRRDRVRDHQLGQGSRNDIDEQTDRDRGPVTRATLPHHLACGSGRVVKRTGARGRFVSWKQTLSMPSIDGITLSSSTIAWSWPSGR